MNDIEDWFQGIDEILRVGDFFAVQFVYSKNILEIGSIDQFYHEHTAQGIAGQGTGSESAQYADF